MIAAGQTVIASRACTLRPSFMRTSSSTRHRSAARHSRTRTRRDVTSEAHHRRLRELMGRERHSVNAMWRVDPNQERTFMTVRAGESGYSMSPIGFGDGAVPPSSASGGSSGGRNGKTRSIGNADAFLSKDELSRLTEREQLHLQRNIEAGEILNKSFRRSRYYPFPRDLTFASEKPLFRKWAAGRQNLVEIGVFEGASSLSFRRVMSPTATLHLIDPFIEIPDSTLVARRWMARLNLTRSGNGKVKWYRDYSYNVVKQWSEPIDFLFIDGDHAERGCILDWNTWHQFVSVGGIVMFHDARFGKSEDNYWDGWPGPTRVVDELFRGPAKLPNWEIVDESGTVVVVRRIY